VSSSGFLGFASPNYEPLAKIGEHIEVNTKLIRKPSIEGFYINESLDGNVLPFDIFPGIRSEILKKIFEIENLKGVIIKTFGTGNAPTDEKLFKEIGKAIGRGIAVVNITQCMQGMVEMGLYDTSMGLLRNGVISGVDMTPEAALVKMMFLLGQGYDIETVKEQMQKNLCGEQSVNVYNFVFDKNLTNEKVCRLNAQVFPAGFDNNKIVKANIRFNKVRTKNYERSMLNPIKICIFLNCQADITTDINIPQCIGVIDGYDIELGFMAECTQKIRCLTTPSRPVQITVVSKETDISWESVVLSVYTDAND
jgi:L-asparaginase